MKGITPMGSHNDRKTGELLVDEGLVHQDDIHRVLAIQEKARASLGGNKNRLFGMILCDLNLITPIDIYCVLEKYGKLLTLPEFLVQKKILSQALVEKTLNRSIALDIPFMSLLMDDGLISKTMLQQIAFDLFHIPFRSISDIVFDGEARTRLSLILEKTQARDQKIIPLVLRDNTLLCGITDPVNLVFVRELNTRFPQYRFKTLFIPFSGFSWFYKVLYGEAWASGKTLEKAVDLSLLLKFSVGIADPLMEDQKVLSLYQRYELVRSLAKCPEQGDRAERFQAFVREQHQKITREFGCRSIEFSLTLHQDQVGIMAFPTKET